MQKLLVSLALMALCAGCAHHRAAHTIALAPTPTDVTLVPDASATSATLAAALPQFSRGAPPVMLQAGRPFYSLEQALPAVQRVSKEPLLAMTEYNGWFWYATEVSRDPNTQGVGNFVKGYAVQKGGFLAWRW